MSLVAFIAGRGQKKARSMDMHKAEELKGRLKVAVGNITGDQGLKREGRLDQASAATKKTIDKAAGAIQDVVNPKKK